MSSNINIVSKGQQPSGLGGNQPGGDGKDDKSKKVYTRTRHRDRKMDDGLIAQQ